MKSELAGPAYRIETDRMVVRCWQPPDVPGLDAAIAASLEHLLPWMPWAGEEPKSPEERLALVRRWRGQFDLDQDFVYGLFDAFDGTVVGGSGLHTRAGEGAREIGYWIRAGYTGRGLASEAAGALTRIGFEVEGLSRIEIHCDPANVASAGVARRLGFRHEATLERRARRPDGSFRDTAIWTMHEAAYPGSPAQAIRVRAFDARGRRLV